MAQLSYHWEIADWLNFGLVYGYLSRSFDKTTIDTETHNLRTTLSCPFLKKSLHISLQANDLLHKARANYWTRRGYMQTRQNNNYDSRNLVLSVRYTLRTLKQSSKGKSNEEEVERL
jgi:hypothetical protein